MAEVCVLLNIALAAAVIIVAAILLLEIAPW